MTKLLLNVNKILVKTTFLVVAIIFFNAYYSNALISNNKVIWLQKSAIVNYGGSGQFSIKLSSPPSGDVDFFANPDTASYLEAPTISVTNATHTFTPLNWNTPWIFTVNVANNSGPQIFAYYDISIDLMGNYSSGPSMGSSYEDIGIGQGRLYLGADDNSTIPLSPLGGVLDEGAPGTVVSGGFNYAFSCADPMIPVFVRHNGDASQQVTLGSNSLFSGAINVIQGPLTAYTTSYTVVDDNLVEGLRVFSGTLDYNTCLNGFSHESILTNFLITDNDTGVVSVLATDSTATEAAIPADNATFRIELDKANFTGEDLVVNYTLSGAAINGTDYTSVVGSTTIFSSMFSLGSDIQIVPINDSIAEGVEIATITITSLSGGAASLFSISSATSTASINISDAVDTAAPTVAINQHATQTDPTFSPLINFTAIFNEPIATSTFTCIDISVTNGNCLSLTFVSGNTYSVNINATTSGAVVVNIPGGVVQDLAGNLNTISTSTDNSVTYDNLQPSVTLNLSSGQASPATTVPILFTVVFSESIATSSFTCVDVGITNGTCGSIVFVSGNAFTVSVTPTSVGNVVATILAGGVQDLAGNLNSVSTSTTNTVNYTGAPSGGGGGGGGGSIVLTPPIETSLGIAFSSCTTTSKTTYAQNQKGGDQDNITRADINDDGKIGILDFNWLVVNYNNKVDIAKFVDKLTRCMNTNIADVSCDGAVNVLDFNSLLVNWNIAVGTSQISTFNTTSHNLTSGCNPNVLSIATATPAVSITISCPLITKEIKFGAINDNSQVQKLQNYLNTKQGESLVTDGVYKINDVEAVKRFQQKYKSVILTPWGLSESTGWVFTSTINKINQLACGN